MFTLFSTAVYIIFGLFIFFHVEYMYYVRFVRSSMSMRMFRYLSLPFFLSLSPWLLHLLSSLHRFLRQCNMRPSNYYILCNFSILYFSSSIFAWRPILFRLWPEAHKSKMMKKNVFETTLDAFWGHQTKISFILPKLCATTQHSFGLVCACVSACASKCVTWITLIRFSNNDDFSFETFSSTVGLCWAELCMCTVILYLHNIRM